ncbi:MAG: multiple sugar transport system substrate-binding protein [Pseudonocardiales bacterium]|nr:multiple sugar transport system substrate-binding protein [Pseudonocardiales bacterium]
MDRLEAPISRRGFLGAAGALGGAVALAACGGKSKPGAGGDTGAAAGGTNYNGPAVTLAFWNGWTGADGDFAKKMVAQFNKANPKVKVTMNVYEWASFFQKLPAAVQSGNGPDVSVMHIDDIPTQAAQQVIVPIDSIAKTLKFSESQFAPAVWNGGLYKGQRYGIPIDVHNLGLYYNQDLFDKAGVSAVPTDENSYMDALDKLKSKGIQGSWVSPFQFTGAFMFESLLWQFGGDMFDKDNTKATWDSDAGVKALTWMVDLVKKGYSPKNVGQDADYISLKNSKNAMNWQGIWQVDDARSQKAKIATAPLPKIGTQKGVWGNSHQFVLPKNGSSDPNKQAAARFFIHWFTSNEAEWAKSAKVPAETELAKSTAFTQGLSYLKSFADDVPAVHFPPAVAGIGDAAAKLYDAVQAAVLMKKSPESALSTSAKQASQIMADNKKKYG